MPIAQTWVPNLEASLWGKRYSARWLKGTDLLFLRSMYRRWKRSVQAHPKGIGKHRRTHERVLHASNFFFTCCSTIVARLKISFWTFVQCEISVSRNNGRQYVRRRRNEALSTNWKAYQEFSVDIVFIEKKRSLHLHKRPAQQHGQGDQLWWTVGHAVE